MPRYTSCSVCGRPTVPAVCSDCKQAASYANPVYKANRGHMIRSARYGVPCVICNLPITDSEQLSIEHIVPIRDGGTHDLDNLGYAHLRCNSGMKPTAEPLRYMPPSDRKSVV